MNRENCILELHNGENTWTPPRIDEESIALSARDDVNARNHTEYLCIFQTEPYIDSIYIIYDEERTPIDIKRFTFHEGYVWTRENERFFHEHCVKTERCSYQGGQIEQIYKKYSDKRPEWHIRRYLTKGLRVLDHIYNCMVENTIKEMLYKSGLEELAANIDEMDQLNLLASKPADLYDGLPIRVLRSVNCAAGATLISDAGRREFVKELNRKFPDLFAEEMNDAQCMYIKYLIKGELTVGETGRLVKSRKKDLQRIWTGSLFDVFLMNNRLAKEVEDKCKLCASIDSIYANYIRHTSELEKDDKISQMIHYLGNRREEYDAMIRRSNRKRNYEWQERGDKYYVRYPQTINDFCRESIYMQNCLMSYVTAVIENDTTILFMRKSDDVNTPFITIEIYEDELMQAYHRFNGDCTKEEAEWIREYCHRHGINTGKFKFDANGDELF